MSIGVATAVGQTTVSVGRPCRARVLTTHARTHVNEGRHRPVVANPTTRTLQMGDVFLETGGCRFRRSVAGWKPAGWSTEVGFHDSMSYCMMGRGRGAYAQSGLEIRSLTQPCFFIASPDSINSDRVE